MKLTHILLAWVAWEVWKDYKRSRITPTNTNPTDNTVTKLAQNPANDVGTAKAGFGA